MERYFAKFESIYQKAADDIGLTLQIIANRYIGQNPPHPVTFRAYNSQGIKRAGDYRYQFDLDKLFPGTPPETMVYAWATLHSDRQTELTLAVSGWGPLTVYWNGAPVFKSNILNERFPDYKSNVKVGLNPGRNDIVLKFIKTRAGFGGRIGTASPKGQPLHFLMPSPEREGQEGWIYTSPLDAEPAELPGNGVSESTTGLKWYPIPAWSDPELGIGQFQRMFGLPEGYLGVGWAKAFFNRIGPNEYTLKGRNLGPIRIYLGEQEVYHADSSGEFLKKVITSYGTRDIVVISRCRGTDWGFDLEVVHEGEHIELFSPFPVQGAKDDWFYLGPLAETDLPGLTELKKMDRLFGGATAPCYWRFDLPHLRIRPYLENPLFGNWNYPLGVTLYGLLQVSRVFNKGSIGEYVRGHVATCTSFFKYAFWDKEQYGAAGLLHLLTNIDSLDDCGSFGSLMLELANNYPVANYREVADFIADYIGHHQVRLGDGALYRKNGFHAFMDDTLWADDLYMSIPFLCRYYRLTGASCYIEDAARQILLYYRYLVIPEKKVLSHVFDLKTGQATGIPWGRGNGWAAFSSSELLEFLPETHPDRPELLRIYNGLCQGYLALQDDAGLWHQVLTDPESYPETSCTAMFIYAFARGVRFGWLEEPDRYLQAAVQAWKGLTQTAIDSGGNIYGVCRGSGFSFTSDYYKNDLTWNLNDTHGIGIVLLAGVEIFKTIQTLHNKGLPETLQQ